MNYPILSQILSLMETRSEAIANQIPTFSRAQFECIRNGKKIWRFNICAKRFEVSRQESMEKLEITNFRTHISQPWWSHYCLAESILVLTTRTGWRLLFCTEELDHDFPALSLRLFLGKNDIMVWSGTLEMCNLPYACDVTAFSPIALIQNSFWQS